MEPSGQDRIAKLKIAQKAISTKIRKLNPAKNPQSIKNTTEESVEKPQLPIESTSYDSNGKDEYNSWEDTAGLRYATIDQIQKYYGDIKWAWKDFIPVGHMTMIAGVQGVGKTKLTQEIISIFTGTKPKWPTGQVYAGPKGKVILLDTEQMRGEYATQLKKMGAKDGDLIIPILGTDPKDMTYTVDIPADLQAITSMAKENNCVAIILDSLTGGHSYNENSSEMKMILQPLSEMTANLQIPVIVVHDLRKQSKGETSRATLDRVRGSVVITKFCRSVIGIYRPNEEDPNSAVRLEVIKSNFCKKPEPLGFTISDNGLSFCEAPQIPHSVSAVEVAADFLMEELSDGPRIIKQVRDQATEAGITNYALFEAKKRLDVLTKGKFWTLHTINGVPYPRQKK